MLLSFTLFGKVLRIFKYSSVYNGIWFNSIIYVRFLAPLMFLENGGYTAAEKQPALGPMPTVYIQSTAPVVEGLAGLAVAMARKVRPSLPLIHNSGHGTCHTPP